MDRLNVLKTGLFEVSDVLRQSELFKEQSGISRVGTSSLGRMRLCNRMVSSEREHERQLPRPTSTSHHNKISPASSKPRPSAGPDHLHPIARTRHQLATARPAELSKHGHCWDCQGATDRPAVRGQNGSGPVTVGQLLQS